MKLFKKNNIPNMKDEQKPHQLPRTRSIMKVISLDESLHHSNISNISKSTCRLSSCNSSSALDRSVSFHNVEIREYNMTIGDNPSARMGPPVGISWEHRNEVSMPLNDYEDGRGERRTQQEMIITRERKYDIIKESGVPNREIASTVRKTNKIKNQRMQTVNNATSFSKFEEAFESAMRKGKRFLLRRNSDSKWWAKWKEDNQDLLDVSVHNGKMNRLIDSNHALSRISSERSPSDEEMSEISTTSSAGFVSVKSHIKPIIISEEEENDLIPSFVSSYAPVLTSAS